ncbi:Hypothetical protein ORPV_121 [Orpheovirus IHUMI-LCC2]|uniref:Ankyrin-repeat protein n=1 Tax=Orpheovirus IHUMI-LCC2 TaxID=2023057 RepID=A0A2I2L3A0_9VIRU|nr:Hypothetical protein ORPV_121 [Orpheovirus IHUMI-LCC2]SNW62025.1 Hypothetical protein ORPV_121 [Orpheovirus IHUMI-LCC2]
MESQKLKEGITLAIEAGSLKLVKFFLREGGSLEFEDVYLKSAEEYGHKDVVEFFVSRKESESQFSEGCFKYAALGHVDKLVELDRKWPEFHLMYDSMFAEAARFGQVEVMKWVQEDREHKVCEDLIVAALAIAMERLYTQVLDYLLPEKLKTFMKITFEVPEVAKVDAESIKLTDLKIPVMLATGIDDDESYRLAYVLYHITSHYV